VGKGEPPGEGKVGEGDSRYPCAAEARRATLAHLHLSDGAGCLV
jgi:hypothetical protein